MTKRHRVFVLGAGFSRPAGFPLATELWDEIRTTAAGFSPKLRAHKINDDLEHYIAFRADTMGEKLSPETVDFEDFMRFLDVEHYLGLRGKDTWSEDGNEGTIVTKYLIGQILSRHVNALKRIPDLYLEFARRLEPSDIVITFNYDTLLEQALEANDKPYRLFSTRFKTISEYSGSVDDTKDEVIVLKVHGSIDWFDRSRFERRIRNHEEQGASPPEDIIFSNVDKLGLEPITDGPRSDSDPLRNIYRAKNLAALYDKDFLFHATPRMLPPSAAKLVYMTNMNDFWTGMEGIGIYNYGMTVVGFSLPQQDEYARQILYEFVTNYQRHNLEKDPLGRQKVPLTIVDYFPDDDAKDRFCERYRFVDWSKTILCGEGFNADTLEHIFAEV